MKVFAIAFVVVAASIMNRGCGPGQGQPQINPKCEVKFGNIANKWEAAVSKALASCKAAMRKQTVAAAPDYLKGAAACEKALAKLYGKSEGKFLAGVDALFAGTPPTCTAADDLVGFGHLVSPVQAPGTNPQDWVKHWLTWAEYERAIKNELFLGADFFNQVATVKTGAGVICPAGTTSDPAVTVPNFCKLEINCREHECRAATAAGSQIVTSLGGGALVTMIPGVLDPNLPSLGSTVYEFCKVKDPFNFDPGFYYLISEPARTINAIQLAGRTTCIDLVKSEGWCNCTGAPVPISDSTNFCQDHINGASTCPGVANGFPTKEGPCFCAGNPNVQCGPGVHFCTGAESFCGIRMDGGFCHPGTTNSALFVAPLSASTPNGGCVGLSTISVTTLPAGGNCGNGNPASFGPDCLPCTGDDTIPPADAAPLPFTTGAAQAEVLDAVLTEGSCSNAADASTQCIENANCGANPNDVCVGAAINPNQTLPTVIGSGANPNDTCAVLEGSVLTGLSFVAAFPALDGAGVGDVVNTVTLACE